MEQLALFDNEHEHDRPMTFVGQDHAALALMPFSAASTQCGPEGLRHTYQVVVDGQLRRIDITVEPGAGGLPTHHDQMVYLALLQLSLARGGASELVFQRKEVFDLLGWQHRNDAWQRLEEGIHRLWKTGIVVRSAMIARDGREYSKHTAARHLIDGYDVAEGRGASCRIIWGELVREALALGDFKRLDWSTVLSLDNPLSIQLYRLLDRVVLAGETTWRVGWHTLATALGMSVTAYARPARFRQVLEPHLAALSDRGILDEVEYERGGVFTFHLPNYLRVQLRGVLSSLGVYPEAARQLVAGYDEVLVMTQCDCFQHGARRADGVGYLVQSIREDYPLHYAADEPQAFAALLELFAPDEVKAVRGLAQRLLALPRPTANEGAAKRSATPKAKTLQPPSLDADPSRWPVEMRAVVRFLLAHAIDPERV